MSRNGNAELIFSQDLQVDVFDRIGLEVEAKFAAVPNRQAQQEEENDAN
ncbi:hypothetical protein [Paenibacillus hemerocallicola]|nr:hypothetical protein [Paenibacillus hemerocallicola]